MLSSMPVPALRSGTKNGMIHHQQIGAYGQPPTAVSAAQNLLFSAGPLASEAVEGVGKVEWVKRDRGVLSSGHGLIAFELAVFCDQGVTDLSAVLRNGFVLRFQAVPSKYAPKPPEDPHAPPPRSSSPPPPYHATFLAPLMSSDVRCASPSLLTELFGALDEVLDATLPEVDPGMELVSALDPTRRYHLDQYCLTEEKRALTFIVELFTSQSSARLSFDDFHTFVSNSEQRDLYHYIGVNKNKRRCFLENRSHVFALPRDDELFIHLVHPGLNSAVRTLAAQLVARGGAMPLQELFDFYMGCLQIPIEARDVIGEGKNRFLTFLDRHPWIFAVFPSKVFVSLRHKLVDFSYQQLIEESIDVDTFYIPQETTDHQQDQCQNNNNNNGTHNGLGPEGGGGCLHHGLPQQAGLPPGGLMGLPGLPPPQMTMAGGPVPTFAPIGKFQVPPTITSTAGGLPFGLKPGRLMVPPPYFPGACLPPGAPPPLPGLFLPGTAPMLPLPPVSWPGGGNPGGCQQSVVMTSCSPSAMSPHSMSHHHHQMMTAMMVGRRTVGVEAVPRMESVGCQTEDVVVLPKSPTTLHTGSPPPPHESHNTTSLSNLLQQSQRSSLGNSSQPVLKARSATNSPGPPPAGHHLAAEVGRLAARFGTAPAASDWLEQPRSSSNSSGSVLQP